MPSDSLWMDQAQSRFPALGRALKANTVVIGGGIAGLTTAYYLAKSGVSVVVLEARVIGRGTTGHSTAHVTSQHDLTYDRWIRRFGYDAALKIAQANENAVHAIADICSSEGIDCDYTVATSCLFTNETAGLRKIARELDAASRLGIKAQMLDPTLCPVPCKAALGFFDQAMIHPIKYINGLADAIVRHGGKLFEHTRALRISDGKVIVKGGGVQAENIVIATHNPVINSPGWYFARMYQHRSYAVALTGAPRLEQMWNCIDPGGHTYRSAGEYVIVCGEDHKTATQRMVDHYGRLLRHAQGAFPDAKPVAQWSAQDGITQDNLPYIGRYGNKTDGLFVATGFGKWGFTQGTIAGQILCDGITGSSNPYAELFDPHRPLVPSALWSFAAINAATLAHFLGGVLRLPSPTCPHLRCKLSWNREERTWDCPCHGSRFEEDGDVIDSPAIHGLTKLS